MLKIIKYELKKQYKTSILLFFIMLAMTLYTVNLSNTYVANESESIDVIQSYISMINSLFLLGYMVYLGYDFTNTLLGNEKYFLFTIPIQTIKIFIAKIITTSILAALMFAPSIINIIYEYNKDRPRYYEIYQPFTASQFLCELVGFYSLCLMVLMLMFFIIFISKKILEKIKFKFLWLIPLGFVFSLYLDLVINKFATDFSPIFIMGFSLELTIVHIVVSIILLILTSYLIDKKVDI